MAVMGRPMQPIETSASCNAVVAPTNAEPKNIAKDHPLRL